MYVDLKGKCALVTGGGTGIGKAISLALGQCAASVVVNYNRSSKQAEETVDDIETSGGRAIALQADVTDEHQVCELIDKVMENCGRLDILVANAGGPTESRPTAELTSEDWDRGIGLNCKAAFFCVKYALPYLPDGYGRIIVTSTISARDGGAVGMLTYGAAKGALNNMVRNWAKELAPRGITVNGIAPGIIWTRIHETMTPPGRYKKAIDRIPLGRDGQPQDCVPPVLMLASPESGFITGQIIEVNGGMSMP